MYNSSVKVYGIIMRGTLLSLRSKRFQQKKKLKGEGEGRRGNACRQNPRFWITPLDISRLGSFVN